MNILLDTNVVIDVLLERQPFYDAALSIFGISEHKIINAYVSASAITDIYYLARKAHKDTTTAIDLLKKLLQVVQIAAVSSTEIYRALSIGWGDFEDAVQYAVGSAIDADYIVTRNVQDFSGSSIPVIEPESFLKLFIKPKNC